MKSEEKKYYKKLIGYLLLYISINTLMIYLFSGLHELNYFTKQLFIHIFEIPFLISIYLLKEN